MPEKTYKEGYKEGYRVSTVNNYQKTKDLIQKQLRPLKLKMKIYKEICDNQKGGFWKQNTIEFKRYVATKNQIRALEILLNTLHDNYEFRIKK